MPEGPGSLSLHNQGPASSSPSQGFTGGACDIVGSWKRECRALNTWDFSIAWEIIAVYL